MYRSMRINDLTVLLFISFLFASYCQANDQWVEVAGQEVYISWPIGEGSQEVDHLPVLMAIHGSGRSADSYCPDRKKSVPFYVHQRDLANEEGYLFVVVSNGINTWGTDQGAAVLEKVYDYICRKFNTRTEWILWGSSAGGVQMLRFLREKPDKVKMLIGTFPVYDLKEAFAKRIENGAPFNDYDLMERINPADFPEALTLVPILIFHGRKDKAVPFKKHSKRLHDDVNRRGGQVKLILVKGGHSTSNWHVYKDSLIRKYLKNYSNVFHE